ncbi:hypothetical protein [Haloglycomyces albus]|uniref:hypothetical protein n=1 Tax=Haloglycomyces albus TaxID=526067 RepID=UPI00046D1300|nr:hypothetical protein [Haloglycomyces albus]
MINSSYNDGPTVKEQAVARAREHRRRRIEAARQREATVEATVVEIVRHQLIVEQAREAISDGVAALKALGETHQSIGELCGMTTADVRGTLQRQKKNPTPETHTTGTGKPARGDASDTAVGEETTVA